MHVEAFHRTLKYQYLMGKVNKRVDKCIHTLLKFARDKAFDRLVKLEKGKLTERIQIIIKRHRASRQLDTNIVIECSDVSWKVKSSSRDHEYYVTHEGACTTNCNLRCNDCNICIHSYFCDCADSFINHTICKHIHLVAWFLQIKLSASQVQHLDDSPDCDFSVVCNGTGPDALLKDLQQKKTTCDVAKMQRKVLDKLSVITAQVRSCTSVPALEAADSHLNSIIGIITAYKSVCDTKPVTKCTSKEPANKNITRQQPFFSTKRKRKCATVRLSKPTLAEKNKICSELIRKSTSDESFYTLQFSGKRFQQIKGTLRYFCEESVVNRATSGGGVITPPDLMQELPDDVVELSWTEFSCLHTYFSKEAWTTVKSAVDTKYKEWSCADCSVVTTQQNMIMCDDCQNWFHWNCADVSTEPAEEWFCKHCTPAIKRRQLD